MSINKQLFTVFIAMLLISVGRVAYAHDDNYRHEFNNYDRALAYQEHLRSKSKYDNGSYRTYKEEPRRHKHHHGERRKYSKYKYNNSTIIKYPSTGYTYFSDGRHGWIMFKF